MHREHSLPQSEVIRAILLEDSPCCGVDPSRRRRRRRPLQGLHKQQSSSLPSSSSFIIIIIIIIRGCVVEGRQAGRQEPTGVNHVWLCH